MNETKNKQLTIRKPSRRLKANEPIDKDKTLSSYQISLGFI
jgi:hypothetical protein